jgi:hypothetical protein
VADEGGVAEDDYFAAARPGPSVPAAKAGRPRSNLRALRLVLSLGVMLGLLVLRLHGSDGMTLAAGSSFGAQPRPPAGVEEAKAPLAEPPVVLPMPAGSYAFLYRQDDHVTPVTWSPCRPIHYVTRQANQPPGGAQLVREAFAEVSRATGLTFVDDGVTTEDPSADRPAYQPDRYGKRWAPVLVSWAGADEVPDFGGDVVGEAGPLVFRTAAGQYAYVSGIVNLDFAKMSRMGSVGRYEVTRAVVLHELGHLVGLDHVTDPVQMMYPQANALARDFGLGDRAGLAALGDGPCRPDI